MTDYTDFLNMSPSEIYRHWLEFITTTDPQLRDTGVATFNSILAEAVAAQAWILIQLLKQKVEDSSILTATGSALSAIVVAYGITRYPGTRATGAIKFSRTSPAPTDFVIPANTISAAKAESGALIKFQTTEEVVLEEGSTSVTAAAQAMVAGTAGNVYNDTIVILLAPVVGITSITNDATFTGGTGGESDSDLRDRALYTIWINGKATIPLITEHVSGVEGVREVKVDTIGQGDVLLIVDSEGGPGDPESAIDDMIAENIAAGCTAPGILAASLRPGGNTFEINDCSGGQVWVRTLQFVAEETEIPFSYLTSEGASGSGSATIPAGTQAGETIRAELQTPLAGKITASSYTGDGEFDLFLGLGEYPYLHVCPTLQAADIDATFVLTATPEVGLLDNIKASLIAKLDSYKIGDELQWEDVYLCARVDFTTGRLFQGIDRIPTFEITCKGQIITTTGESIVMASDDRVEPGDVNPILAS